MRQHIAAHAKDANGSFSCAHGDRTRVRYQLRRNEGIFLTPTLQDGSIEKYLQATDTTPMEKAETVRYIWFSSDGEYTEARSGNALPQTQWQNTEKFAAPTESSTVKLWLVAQDVRGGVDWQSYELQLTD